MHGQEPDIEDMFYDAGQFYCGRTSSWLDQIELHNQSQAIILPSWRAVDIDTDSDWTQAEQAHKLLSNLEVNMVRMLQKSLNFLRSNRAMF